MIEGQRHVLAVYPHPDDETFGKAGTFALFAKAGVPVTLMCGTLGQMGRNMGKPFFATRETLPSIRELELRNACKVMGIEDLRLMGLRDKTVEFEDPEKVADEIETVIREVNPSVVMTYYPRHGVHPDHDALSHATVLAVARLPKDKRPPVWGSVVTGNGQEKFGPPHIEIDVQSVMDIKLDAMRAHASQSQAMMKRMEEESAQDPKVRAEFEKRFATETYWIYPIED